MDNGRQQRRRRWIPPDPPRAEWLPPTAWLPARPPGEAPRGADSELTIAELVALVREAGGMVGGHGLWDPRHEREIRRMLTTALEMEGVLPPGSVASLGP